VRHNGTTLLCHQSATHEFGSTLHAATAARQIVKHYPHPVGMWGPSLTNTNESAAFLSGLDTTKVREPILPTLTTNPGEAPSAKVRRSSEEFVVGAVLGPDSNGSFDQLLAAFSNLRRSGRRAKLAIFAAHDPQQFSRRAAIRDLNPDVLWVPDELSSRNLLQGCDVLVSLQDGVPLLVLQAISLCIPSITTAVRVPEALRNQRTVTFIRHGDKNGLQEALLRLSEQPKRTPNLGFNSQESIAKYYSDTYLWRENCFQSTNGHQPKGRALIKKVLFGLVPSRRLLEHGNQGRPEIALTVDDGPDPVYTPRILDIFRDHAVKATFFVVGGAAEQYPNLVMRMKKEGHDVGSHSYSHPYFHRLSWTGAVREIRMTRWVLDRILGEECTLFRPPHGKLSLRSLIPAWAAGQSVVMWNVDLKDYRASTGEVEAQLDRTTLSSGDIILYHGINEAALTALPRVIKAALDKGRKSVTISELIWQ
jgi:peptidoglycan/xylan/chitin deacetylase (PgdA/CDA1 family)